MTYELCDLYIHGCDLHYLTMTEWEMTTVGWDQIQRLELVALPKLLMAHILKLKSRKYYCSFI